MAEQAQINENYVSDLEHGRKEVCLRTLQTLAKAFGMKTSELLDNIE